MPVTLKQRHRTKWNLLPDSMLRQNPGLNLVDEIVNLLIVRQMMNSQS